MLAQIKWWLTTDLSRKYSNLFLFCWWSKKSGHFFCCTNFAENRVGWRIWRKTFVQHVIGSGVLSWIVIAFKKNTKTADLRNTVGHGLWQRTRMSHWPPQVALNSPNQYDQTYRTRLRRFVEYRVRDPWDLHLKWSWLVQWQSRGYGVCSAHSIFLLQKKSTREDKESN